VDDDAGLRRDRGQRPAKGGSHRIGLGRTGFLTPSPGMVPGPSAGRDQLARRVQAGVPTRRASAPGQFATLKACLPGWLAGLAGMPVIMFDCFTGTVACLPFARAVAVPARCAIQSARAQPSGAPVHHGIGTSVLAE
jgi:hypothetical protein